MQNKGKKNVFEHILYEFHMYLYTSMLLISGDIHMCANMLPPNKQLAQNLTSEGHQHYLRNIINFFSNYKNYDDDIIYKDIIKEDILKKNNFYYYDLSESSVIRKDVFPVLNKGVSHLTLYRTRNNISKETNNVINNMFNGTDNIIGIPQQIFNFLNLLEPANLKIKSLSILKDDINSMEPKKYHNLKKELVSKKNQEIIKELKSILEKLGIK